MINLLPRSLVVGDIPKVCNPALISVLPVLDLINHSVVHIPAGFRV
jgi:hypothetical protein